MKNNQTTKRHFEVFKEECQKWLDFFGLKGWQVDYLHDKVEGSRACIGWKIAGRVACITLGTDWEDYRKTVIPDDDIKKAAFHEVCELLLSRLSMMAKNKIANHEDAVDEEVHNVIRILENVVFKEGTV